MPRRSPSARCPPTRRTCAAGPPRRGSTDSAPRRLRRSSRRGPPAAPRRGSAANHCQSVSGGRAGCRPCRLHTACTHRQRCVARTQRAQNQTIRQQHSICKWAVSGPCKLHHLRASEYTALPSIAAFHFTRRDVCVCTSIYLGILSLYIRFVSTSLASPSGASNNTPAVVPFLWRP